MFKVSTFGHLISLRFSCCYLSIPYGLEHQPSYITTNWQEREKVKRKKKDKRQTSSRYEKLNCKTSLHNLSYSYQISGNICIILLIHNPWKLVCYQCFTWHSSTQYSYLWKTWQFIHSLERKKKKYMKPSDADNYKNRSTNRNLSFDHTK